MLIRNDSNKLETDSYELLIQIGGSYPDTFSESDTGCQGRKNSVRLGKVYHYKKVLGLEKLSGSEKDVRLGILAVRLGKSCQTRKNSAKIEKDLETEQL